ncbi:MAG TPA: MFS transporter [Caulobacteraceae bacterium]|nr:MFS transporter [Caulobacteraceae bacterium]
MAFLTNDAVNRVIVHSGVKALAESAGGVFFFVYLLKAGLSVEAALLSQAAIFTLRFTLRPAMLPLAVRFGVKPLLIAGTLLMALQYPLLALVHGVGPALAVVCAAAGVGELVYYLAGNAYWAIVGDIEHRGQQTAAREGLVAAVGIVGPLAGGAALTAFGPGPAFAAVGLVQALAALPLIGLPNVAVARHAPGAFRAARPGFILIAADGWFDVCYIHVWQIALFLALAQSFTSYGGAMALAGLAAAIAGLLLGRHIDAGGGRRAVTLTYSVAAAAVLLRAASLGSPWLAVAANAAGAMLWPLLGPTVGACTHNLAKTSPCAFRFHMGTEGGWDVGAVAASLTAAALVRLGAPLTVPLLMGLVGVAGSVVLLRRYYAGVARALVAAPAR